MRLTLWENVKFKRPVVIDEEGNIYELNLVGHVQTTACMPAPDMSPGSVAYTAKTVAKLDECRSTPKHVWED